MGSTGVQQAAWRDSMPKQQIVSEVNVVQKRMEQRLRMLQSRLQAAATA